MERFLTRHHDRIAGILTGFDRMRFRGTLRTVSNLKGLRIWLRQHDVLFKDFGRFAAGLSQQLLAHGRQVAEAAGRPFEYVASSKTRKEDRARAILERDQIREGLIAVFSCVEGCRSVTVRGNRATRRLELVAEERRCAHLYFYYWDRNFGLMHLRLQTWLPFTLHIGINGREWLAQQLRQRGCAFTQVENCVYAVADMALAQRLLAQLETRRWASVLRAFARRVNPLLAGHKLRPYYWSLDESEYATDLAFHTCDDLQAVYPALVRHAFDQLRTRDVLRFFGRKALVRTVEVTTRVQRRVEGTRVKHWLAENSLKMYDKLGQVLRVETTLNAPRRFKVFRATAPGRARHWVPLRKGIADLPRRVALSKRANARYLDALSQVAVPIPVARVLDPVSHSRVVAHRPYRALRPIAPDESACMAVLLDGRTLLDGIRARDLREALGGPHHGDPRAARRLAGQISRRLRLYRAHGLIAKIAHTHRYRVTPEGHRVITAALACRAATLDRLAA